MEPSDIIAGIAAPYVHHQDILAQQIIDALEREGYVITSKKPT